MQIGLTGILTALFIALKLTNVIQWEWIWVLSPLWISFLLWMVFIVGTLTMGWILMGREEKRMRNRRR
jgi:hypothetical protein